MRRGPVRPALFFPPPVRHDGMRATARAASWVVGARGARRLHSCWSHVPSAPRAAVANAATGDEFAHLSVLEGVALERQLKDEAAFLREALLRPTTPLQMALYDELAARLPATHRAPGEPHGEYEYYTRTGRRANLPLYCRARRRRDGGASGSAESEQVLLDLGALADAHGFAALGSLSVSADHSLLAYTVDTAGDEAYELRVVELGQGGASPRTLSTLPRVARAEWADGETLIYTRLDGRGRPCRALLHTAGTRHESADAEVHAEPDDAVAIDVAITKGRRWLTISSSRHTSSEVRLLSAAAPRTAPPLLVTPREDGCRYYVEELAAGWLLVIGTPSPQSAEPSRSLDSNLALSVVHESELPAPWRSWRPLPVSAPAGEPAGPGTASIEDVDVFGGCIALYERLDAVPRLRLLELSAEHDASPAAPRAPEGHTPPPPPPPPPPSVVSAHVARLPHGSAPCAITPAPNRDFETRLVHFSLSSPCHPPTPYAYDVPTRTARLRPHEPSHLGASGGELACELTHANADDGVAVPLTLVHRAGLELTSSTPLHVLVYGAYGAPLSAEWRAEHLPLLDRGWAVALAHVRGGGELGPSWHRAACGVEKRRSALDLCAAVRELHARGISSPPLSTAAADSAGALALGGLLNETSDALIGAGVVLRSPFLDPLGAMSEPSLPLTVEEREEWGDPLACEATARAMRRYSPYGGLSEQQYPPMLLVVARRDARVCFTQAVRYVARLRHRSGAAPGPGAPPQLLHVRTTGGHLADGGRYRRLEQASLELAFLLQSVGGGSSL